MIERDLIALAKLEASQKNGVLFRNSVGQAWQGGIMSQSPDRLTLKGYRKIAYGLKKGSSDLIGIRPIVITENMVGCLIGQFWAVELKTKRDRIKSEQSIFLEQMARRGALSQIVKETDEDYETITIV